MRSALKAAGACCLLTMLAVSSRTAEDDVHKAVERGVAYLKAVQRNDGAWTYAGKDPQEQTGATALAAMTLLECGVPPDDPAVEKAVALVRQASIPLTHTYSLSLAIMLLDRLGDAGDEALVQSMAIRILGGQNDEGGWTYQCPALDENEQRRLANYRPQQNELVGRRERPSAGNMPSSGSAELLPEMKDQLARLTNRAALAGAGRLPGDNSNTQFATLALWVARRHGVPVDFALAKVAARFRTSQHADGSWHYFSAMSPGRTPPGTPAMTCAALLGLAVGHGAQPVLRTNPHNKVANAPGKQAKATPNVGSDFAVRTGLLYLARHIGTAGPRNSKNRTRMLGGPIDYYFMWSLERVGMIYGLKTIGKKDWYAWGSQTLLEHQSENGSWQGKYGAMDTCFALLFLQRANVARDLTAALSGKVRDPGDVKLRAGGIGGEALLEQGSPAATSPHAPPPSAPSTKSERPVLPRKPEGKPNAEPEEKEEKQPAAPPVRPAPAPTPPTERADDQEIDHLVTALVQAPADKQETLIEKLKERKGVAHTEALARAIPQLKGAIKQKARDALAERLTRMTSSTLREKLQDESPEVRRAATLACAMKEDRSFVPDLIARLDDGQRTVSLAAHAALKALTSKDFGPSADATPRERASAMQRWQEWWKSQEGAK